MSQREFAKRCGLSNGAISIIESGVNPHTHEPLVPTLSTINQLAKGMNISIQNLIESADDVPISLYTEFDTNLIDESLLITNYRKLNELGKQEAQKRVDELTEIEKYKSIGINRIQLLDKEPTIQIKHSVYKVSAGHGFQLGEGDDWGEPIEVPDTPQTRKADFAITIEGNSMEPEFHSGDIILVKHQNAIDIGEIGVFRLDKDVGYLKKYGGDRLISLNDEYEDIMLADYPESACIGKVIGIV